MATSRGNFDLIGQSQVSNFSGGVNAQQAVTTDTSTKPNGAGAVWLDGNLVAGSPGSSGGTHTEILTDGMGNFIFANGDLIYTPGVPN